ncbi:uncharacterized protein LOC133701044 isoform X5 [Populus nigra]|uniref:uncharacterized protein LOC133701044 isoform X5 n=1 Tax=Populus nigra TaxID=3691 RepID=UPI002B26A0DA|nr:uncharacterized protein LOC133701044 isoform X5 [Populus nigra]
MLNFVSFPFLCLEVSFLLKDVLVKFHLQIESLVTEICNTTSIAEFELKLGGFRLYVMRDLTEKNEPTSQPLPPPPLAVTVKTTTDSSDLNGSASTSLAISKQEPSFWGIKSFLDRAADEGLMILQSPRVGFFRRSRTIKGKRAPPSCKEKQIIKEGQVLCYIEQLGGELPIESDISGEVIKILREDGDRTCRIWRCTDCNSPVISWDKEASVDELVHLSLQFRW